MPVQTFTQLQLLFEIQQWKHKSNVWNLFKVDSSDKSDMLLWCFHFWQKRLQKNYYKKWFCEFDVPKFCSTMCNSRAQEPVFRKVFVNFAMKIFRHNLQEQTFAIVLIENLVGTNFCDCANREPCRNKLSRLC